MSRFFFRCGITALSLLTVTHVLVAAEEPRSRQRPGGSVEERFRQFDRNGDGKLTPDEFPNAELFKRMDHDGDGVVTPEEAKQAFGGANRRAAQGRGARPSTSVTSQLAEMTTTLDVSYATPAGQKDPARCLDIYAPKDAANLPVMIYVHGGGWQRGDKGAVGAKASFFIHEGYVLVSVGYRLWPKVNVATEAQDVADAVAWVHDHIAERGGDPKRLFLMGHSAGAHLVSLVATDERYLKKASKDLDILRGVVELDTQALDVPKMLEGGNTTPSYAPFGQDAALWHAVSPRHYVAPGKKIPPFFLVVANSREEKLDQARQFQKALRNVGVRCEFVEAPEHDHGSLNRDIGVAGDKVTVAMGDFLASILRGPRPKASPPAPPAGVNKPARLPDKASLTGAALHQAVVEYAALGDHRTATPVDRATAEWLAGKLRTAGLAVSLQEFSVAQFRLDEVRFAVDGKAIEAFPFWPPAATDPAAVEGKLVQAGQGQPGALHGAIALLDWGSMPRRRSAADLRAIAEAGAVAAVMVVASPAGQFQLPNLTPHATRVPLPVVVVGSKDIAALHEAAHRKSGARLLVKGAWEKDARAFNIIGTLDRGGPRIVVSTPYSGWFRCGGERGGGLGVLLGLAEWAVRENPSCGFTFVATSGHELGGLGMKAFLNQKPPLPRDVLCWLHLGANFAVREESRIDASEDGNAGRKPKVNFNQPGWRPLLEQAFIVGPTVELVTRNDGPGELQLVMEAGYRAIGLAGGGSRFMHAPGDGPENTTPAILENYLLATTKALAAIAFGQARP